MQDALNAVAEDAAKLTGNSDRNTRIKVRVHDKHSFQVAKEPVDLRFVEQLADSEQTAALAQMVRYCLEKGLPRSLHRTGNGCHTLKSL